MSSIDSKLFAIYIDELGNGDINQNHPNVYLNVLEDLGLQIPSIHSKEFVQQQQILDVSFQKPLLTLTTSLFPKTFQAEILGYTLVRLTVSTRTSVTSDLCSGWKRHRPQNIPVCERSSNVTI